MSFRRSALSLAALAAALAMAPGSARSTPAASTADAPFWTGVRSPREYVSRSQERLERAKRAIARMLAIRGPRTVENTLRPYDDAIFELDGMASESSLMENVHPDSVLRAAAERQTQAAAAYATQISLDRRVYEALQALDLGAADPETRHYVANELRDFRLAGVDKDEPTRRRIQSLNEEIVKISQEFDRNIRDDQPTVAVSGAAELEGTPEDFAKSHAPGPDGRITLAANEAEYFPIMTFAKSPDLRKRMWMAFSNRGSPKNLAVLDSLLSKYHQLARRVGFASYADLLTADKMVGSAKNARDFIDRVVRVSGDRAAREAATLLERKRRDQPEAAALDYWDRFYYPEAVRRERYSFDSQALRPYFPYRQVKQGVLDIASRMFGVTFRSVKDAPVWHPSVECWEMLEDGKLVGRFYLDMHPRPNKYDHAAQFDIRTGVEGRQIPEAALVCNLPGGEGEDPGLCGMDDVNTVFHEFGHLLHTLFAGHHRWCGIGGIRMERDFVEAPSQMLEEWMRDPKVLGTFARHWQTGAPIPDSLLRQMERADRFAESSGPRGLFVRRQMVLADLSLSIYDRPPSEVNVDGLFHRLNDAYLPYPLPADVHLQCSFGHLANYTAGYYTYMWSQVIAKDLFSAFRHDDLLDPAVARRYRDTVLAPGGSLPAAKLVENFLGRPFGFEPYRAWLDEPAVP